MSTHVDLSLRIRLNRLLCAVHLICTWIVCSVGYGQQQVSVSTATWSVDRNLVHIAYDLKGDQTRTYEVSLLLLKDGDVSFRVKPNRVIGDIGAGIAAGEGKTIVWDFLKDLSQRPLGTEYFFQLSVDSIVVRTPSDSFIRESTLTVSTHSSGSPQLSLEPRYWNRVGDKVRRPFTARAQKGDSILVNVIVRNTGTGSAESLFVSAQESSWLLRDRLVAGDSTVFSFPIVAEEELEDSLSISVFIGERREQFFVDTTFSLPLEERIRAVDTNAVPGSGRTKTPDSTRVSVPDPMTRPSGPTLLKTVEPVYPPEALRQGIEGGVRVRVEVGVDGKVKNATILDSPSALLNDPVIKAVMQYEFTPTTVGMKLTDGILEITIRFALPKER